MSQVNFYFTGALDPEDPALLYVERPEDTVVRQALAQVGKSCVLISLIGARQTGKTSLLNRLHAEYDAANSGWIAIKLDLMPLSDYMGEVWYQQLTALCCLRLQQKGVGVNVEEVAASCTAIFTPPFSARGWAELLRLACRRLDSNQRLLISLDEVGSVPHDEWEPFFSNLRAVHQAAGAPNDSPELRRLGMILAGAFVPRLLIRKSDRSPFNISIKVYMSAASPDHIRPFLDTVVHHSVALDEAAQHELYAWSGGLLYHLQRVCALLAATRAGTVAVQDIEEIVDDILLDDTYLDHMSHQLEQHPELLDLTRIIFQRPIQSTRANEAVALLEIAGVIRLDPELKKWRIVNRLSERYLEQYYVTEAQPMSAFDPIAMAAVIKAVDFLFDQAGKLMEERREARKQRKEDDDTSDLPPDAKVTTKQEVQSCEAKTVFLKDIPEEVKHCINMIELYRRNKRAVDEQIVHYGGYVLAPSAVKNELRLNEDGIKLWCQNLKNLVEQAYGHKITIIGLN